MNFGKKYRVGNFELVKISKALSRKDVALLRKEAGMGYVKGLNRATLPFIKVSSISGNWAVEYAGGCAYYAFIDQCFGDKGMLVEEHRQALVNICTLLYADTMTMGDGQYFTDKGNALKGFLERQKSSATDEEDEADLEYVKEKVEYEQKIGEMAEHVDKLEKEEKNGKASKHRRRQ